MKYKYCSSCGAKNSNDSSFCVECGEKIILKENDKIICTSCGYEAIEGEKYCPECGTVITVVKSKEKTLKSPYQQRAGKKQSRRVTKATTTLPVKKKKGGILRFLGKAALLVFAILIVGVVGLYFLGDSIDDSYVGNEFDTSIEAENSASDFVELEADLSLSKAIVGDLNQNGIQLNIPKETFNQNVKIQVKESVEVSPFDEKRASLLGTPFEITIDQKSKRLNKPVTVNFKLTEQEISELEHPEDLWIGYYGGNQWNYFKPLEVNLSGKFVRFETYHFSLWSKAKPTKEERIKEFAQEKAVEQWSRKSNSEPIQKAVKNILRHKLGIESKSMTQDIVEAIISNNEFGKLALDYSDNKNVEVHQALANLAGKGIVLVLKDYEVSGKGKLKSLLGNASKVSTIATMAGSLYEGNAEEAAKALSREILNSHPVTKLFVVGAKVIGNEINRWKNQEIKNAYEVYSKGINKYGYKAVDKGNFEDIWNQLNGQKDAVRRQIVIDEKKRYAKQFKGKEWGDLSEKEKKYIEQKVKENLKRQFEERVKKEKFVSEVKKSNLKLIEAFKKRDLLEKGKLGYPKDSYLELRLRRLFSMTQMVLRDTKSKIGYVTQKEGNLIDRGNIAKLIKIWYEYGEESYRKELMEQGYITESKETKPEIVKPKSETTKKTDGQKPGKLNTEGVDGIVDIIEPVETKAEHWVLSETLVEHSPSSKHKCYNGSTSISDGGFSYSREVVTGVCNNDADNYSALKVNGSWSKPPEILIPGKEYPMNCSINRTSKIYDQFHFNASIRIYMDNFDTACGGITRKNIGIGESLKVGNRGGKATLSWAGKFKAPSFGYAGSSQTKKFQIKVSTVSGCIRYIYTWKK